MSGRDWTALWALTLTLARRLLREGLVMRSMIWPTLLSAGTLMATLVVLVLMRTPGQLAIVPDLDPELRAALEDEPWQLVPSEDPAALVRAGDAWAGTDGATLWLRGPSSRAARVEGILREHRGARWRPTGERELPKAADTGSSGQLLVRMLMLLFTLYGVVFGLGMVARDRDDGTLEAELSLPIARWVPGAARWLSGTVVLTAFLAYAVAVFHALLGVDDAAAMLRHGFAASGGAVALGILVVGGAGIKRGFSGPLAAALTAATGLLGFGAAIPGVGQWLPVCSVLAGGSGWVPAAATLLAGVLASAGFALRSARA